MNKNIAFPASLIVTVAIATAACSHVRERAADNAAAQLTSTHLRKFESMEEFEAYRRQLHEAAHKHGIWWARTIRGSETRTLLATTEVTPCNAAIEECGAPELSEIAVTASKATKSASITNNQEAHVDEGDIVKQHGRFLIVLQDGRLFCVDTGRGVGELRLADRINIYSSAKTNTWYDELLIHENSLIVTGYNYGENASEINVISIGSEGELELQARYFIESEDYYSGNNYASRMVRGRFLVYTPLHLVDLPKNEPLRIPRIRRWTPQEGFGEWQPLFAITDVYRPIQPTLTPTLHVVSVCRIMAHDFGCDSRGVTGPAYREVYVSSDNVYLWLTSDRDEWAFGERYPDDCPDGADLYSYAARRSTAFQIPIESGAVRAMHTIGTPYDQFAFDERDQTLLALLVRAPRDCLAYGRMPMTIAALPLNAFSTSPAAAQANDYRRLTLSAGGELSSRYTKDHVVYAAAQRRWMSGDDAANEIVAVSLSQGFRWERVSVSHRVERVEVLGDHAVAFGPSGTADDLGVSTLRLGRVARVADTAILPGIVESEGRSHAFNSLVDDAGQGLFGLPTLPTSKKSYGFWWNVPSDVQFFATDAGLHIAPLGELAGQHSTNKDYECEVSCIDWYGNARPIFIGDRIFALTGTQLIEGQPFGSGIAEVGRVDLTSTASRAR